MSLADKVFDRMQELAPWVDEDELRMIGEHLVAGEIVLTVDGWEGLVFMEGNLNESFGKKDKG